ncbi:MAG: hypothetical protein AB1584_05790 [Pseudomonadota bacterium]
MSSAKPAVVTSTVLNNEATKDVKVKLKRTVTYVINIKTAKKLSLPYAVAINGAVQDAFKSKPRKVGGDGGKIVVKNVEPGARVSLFLNSDAHPGFRKEAVYGVTPNERDVVVNIVEKVGRCADTDIPVQTGRGNGSGSAQEEKDVYVAALTGNVWMRVSHKYSAGEVDAFLPPDTNPVVKAAVRKIYDGLTKPLLEIDVPSKQAGAAARTVSVKFEDGENPRENIANGYHFFAEGLTRVHPAGYAAIIAAAIEADVAMITMTSAWRPMLGSIAHRAGLGLDVNYVGATRMNRQSLRKERAVKSSTVSEAEKKLLAAFEEAKEQQLAANRDLIAAESEAKAATGGDPQRVIGARQKLKAARETSVAAERLRKEAEIAWNAERDKNEPYEVRRFRESLIKSRSVVQVFDPWFMDANTQDGVNADANMQKSENEKLHAHHLHITVREPNIL